MTALGREGFRLAFSLKGLLNVKSDDIAVGDFAYDIFIDGRHWLHYGMPESFQALIVEFQTVGLDLRPFKLATN